MKPFKLRAVAAVAATGALVAGSLIGGVAAQAADPADIDVNRKGSIKVHKHEMPVVSTTQHNGSQLNPAPTNPVIQGVTFEVKKINANLATQAGWNKIKTMTPAAAANDIDSSFATQTKQTNTAGLADFTNLPVGAYLVTETAAPAHVLAKADPFIVTIPFPSKATNSNNKTWLYDVHVYPKNAVTSKPTKTKNDSSAFKAGDNVTWIIEQTVPTLKAGEKLTQVVVRDVLDAKLTYVSATVKVNNAVKAPDANLTVVHTPGTRTLEVTVKAAHLTNLTAGQKVRVEVVTRVNQGGNIPNTATTIVTSPSGSVTSTTTPAHTPWGYIDVLKRSAGDNTALKGAIFEVYKDNACTAAQKVDVPAAQLTTGVNGKFPAPVLLKAGTYYLKEATAPLGYVVPTQNCRQIVVAATHTTAAPSSITIDNEKTTVPNLPLTGSQGQMLLWAIGGVLVLGGLVTVVALRKRQAVK